MINKLLEVFSLREAQFGLALLAVGLIVAYFNTPIAIAYTLASAVAYANSI